MDDLSPPINLYQKIKLSIYHYIEYYSNLKIKIKKKIWAMLN